MTTVFGDKAIAGEGYFGVFDGHAGVEIAQYAATHLQASYVASANYKTDIKAALKDAFDDIDKRVVHKCNQEVGFRIEDSLVDTSDLDPKRSKIRSGCTAVVGTVRDQEITVAWVGDSRAVLVDSIRGAQTLNTAHSPEEPDEYHRVEAAGGVCLTVQGELRVNGVLNLSRSFGDVLCKPVIIAEPDLVSHTMCGTETCLILCCDGVWDVLEEDVYAQALAALCRSCNTKQAFLENYHKLAEGICNKAKSSGSTDNMTCVCVFLKPLDQVWRDYNS